MKNRGFGVIEVIIIVAILGLLGLVGWYAWQANNKASTTSQVNTSQSSNQQNTEPQKAFRTYTNTRHHYSFDYPEAAEIYADTNVGGQKSPVQPDSDSVFVKQGDNTFSVAATSFSELNDANAKGEFGATPSEDIETKKVVIAETSGLEIVFKKPDPQVTSSFYFIQQKLATPVLRVTITKSDGLHTVLESLRFNP